MATLFWPIEDNIHFTYIYNANYVNGRLTGNVQIFSDWSSWGLMTRQPLLVILCRLPEKGRKEIVKEKKDRDKEERGKWKKVKEQKK